MRYTVSGIAAIINAEVIHLHTDAVTEHLLFDSRRVFSPSASLFFALSGERRDGHTFIPELYQRGVRQFVISRDIDTARYPESAFLKTSNTLQALQQLAAHHRGQFSIPVIGITGSNGKTIVKEWLFHLLHEDFQIVRSPKSYNSQIGVPVSVWLMDHHHSMGIFEAGISKPGEMERLEKIIRPTIGVLTNIGDAHSEGFADKNEKLNEKLKLFSRAAVIIHNGDDKRITAAVAKTGKKSLSWGKSETCDVRMVSVERKSLTTHITLDLSGRQQGTESGTFTIRIPFTDDASVENAVTCCCVMLYLKAPFEKIAERMKLLAPVNMRLELKKGINHCTVINDSYSADLQSLHIALNFLQLQNTGTAKTVILSDFLQSGLSDEELYSRIAAELMAHRVSRVIGIGNNIATYLKFEDKASVITRISFYKTTEAFLQHFRFSDFKEEIILIKGARPFGFERIAALLEQKTHETILEINLNALVHNLKEYQRLLRPEVKTMAMVKAFAYGSGGAEIAGILQFHKTDYLAVAYTDEGVELRRAGIHLPIMILNAEPGAFDALTEHALEPAIYSMELLREFGSYLQKEGLRQYPVHLELETGMNRLGFPEKDIEPLCRYLKASGSFRIQSVFSHLAGSEEKKLDAFSRQQFVVFKKYCDQIEKTTGYSFLKHIANSAAIIRHPEMQMDMVRLGIGMYGTDVTASGQLNLEPVATLKSTIAQIRKVKAGESVSYSRSGRVDKDSVIATVRIGYADGYSRKLGNGKGKMLVRGRPAPVVGVVCMDMTMIDVTGIDGVEAGEEVIVFGKDLPAEQLAEWAETIPYEIMTSISQRVKRVYFLE